MVCGLTPDTLTHPRPVQSQEEDKGALKTAEAAAAAAREKARLKEIERRRKEELEKAKAQQNLAAEGDVRACWRGWWREGGAWRGAAVDGRHQVR